MSSGWQDPGRYQSKVRDNRWRRFRGQVKTPQEGIETIQPKMFHDLGAMPPKIMDGMMMTA